MKRNCLWLTQVPIVLSFVLLLVILQGCSNAAKDTIKKTEGLPSVTVILTEGLQRAIGLDSGQLQLFLVLDNGTPQSIPLSNKILNLPDLSEESHLFSVQAFYALTINTKKPLLLAEVAKSSAEKNLVFSLDEWISIPYDRNNNGSIDQEEIKSFDEDDDGMLNLAEILVGGNPFNPAPTFVNPASVRIPEPQTEVLTLQAISPRTNSTVNYKLSGGENQALFLLNGNSLNFTVPSVFDPNSNNDYQVQVTADDSTYTTTQMIIVSVTDVFNLTVSIGFKQLNFSWASLVNASYYKLLVNPDGQSGFGEIPDSGSVPTLNYTQEVAVHLFDHVNAQYMLEAYDVKNVRLKTSTILAITDNLLDAIGYFKAFNTDAGDNFGVSVSLSADGNTLAVGAYLEDSAAIGVNDTIVSSGDNSIQGAGAVYVYTRVSNSGQWGLPDYIKASNTGTDGFGGTVSLSADGNTLAVGATGESSAATGVNDTSVGGGDESVPAAGAVYVYTRAGNTNTWNPPDYIKSFDTGIFDLFGNSVSLSADGNTLVVGARGEASAATGVNDTILGSGDDSAANAGAVYIYARASNTSIWIPMDYIKASNSGANDYFGYSVNLSGDGNTLAVGAFFEASAATGVNNATVGSGDNSTFGAGAVYVYTRTSNNNSWGSPDYIKASNTDADDLFGVSVDLSADGNTLVVGARGEASAANGVNDTTIGSNDNSALGAGAVYIFTRASKTDLWGQLGFIKSSNTGFGDKFGRSVSLSADSKTLVVGAQSESSAAIGINDVLVGSGDNSAADAGAVYIY